MGAPATADAIREVNTRYHDAAADEYDAKWGIDFGDVGLTQTRTKVAKALGGLPAQPFGRALEIGAGTGYFSLNLVRAGLIDSLVATDISPGMLTALERNAAALDIAVETHVTEAERLPFPDASFDLVLGHAVLHHLPDLAGSFREFHRLLRPGGQIVFAGEPSARGDRLASIPKGAATRAAPLWRRLVRADALSVSYDKHDGHSFEDQVDVHAFVPSDLARFARDAGFEAVAVRGEELLANWFGWANRALEASADPEQVPMWWKRYAFHGYIALQHVDRRLLEPRLPAGIFYNLMISATRPA
jgi:ubiquinone/menaquinone biosynthesis C-methylase UbiE